MRLDFFLPGEPPTATAQEKGERIAHKNGRAFIHHYTKTKLLRIREQFMWDLSGHRPAQVPKGPVRLWTIWTWTPIGKHKVGTFRDTKPDTDNIVKEFKDCMAKSGYFENDSRVVDERVIKRWGSKPGIRVILETINHQEAENYEQ